jgi:glutaredoxin/glutathione-dependent peroxiredoxin
MLKTNCLLVTSASKTAVLLVVGIILLGSAPPTISAYYISSLKSPTSVTSSRRNSESSLYLWGRFRKKQVLEIPPPIAVGDPLPNVDVEMLTRVPVEEVEEVEEDLEVNNDETEEIEGTTAKPPPIRKMMTRTVAVSISEVLGNGTSILVGMPGAFTPVCTSEHLPGFVAASSRLQSLGVKTVAVVTTNDRFVNEEWARSVGVIPTGKDEVMDVSETSGSILTLSSDADATLIKALGMAEDMGFGIGVRSKRFALVCENGNVTNVLLDEEGLDQCEMTSAKNLIQLLTPEEPEVAIIEEVEESIDPVMLVGGGVALTAILLALFFLGGSDNSAVSGDSSTAMTTMIYLLTNMPFN